MIIIISLIQGKFAVATDVLPSVSILRKCFNFFIVWQIIVVVVVVVVVTREVVVAAMCE